MTNWIKALCLIAGVGAIGACGDDDDDGGGSSGVSSSKKASELSDDEVVKLCEFGVSQIPSPTIDQACTLGGVTESTTKAECDAFVMVCKDNLTEADLEEEETDCSEAPDDSSACDATVSEIENCYKALGSALKDVFSATCDDAGKISEEDLSPNPPACQAVEEKCSDEGDSTESDDSFDDEATSSDTTTGGAGARALATTLSRMRELRTMLRSRL